MSHAFSPFKPELFGKLASQLLNDDHYEESSRIRTSVGRAYYATFLVARSRLEALGIQFQRESVHREVHNQVKRRDRKLAQKLSTLRQARNDADYELFADFTIHAARSYTELCRILIDSLSKLS